VARKKLPEGGRFKISNEFTLHVPKTLRKGLPKETWQRLNFNLSGGKASPVDFGDVASIHSKASRHDKASVARELQARAYLHEGEITDAVWSLDLASDASKRHADGLKAKAEESSGEKRERYVRGAKYWSDRVGRMKVLADTWEKHDLTKLARNRPRSPGQPK
jgi:hypothetical protein